MYRYRLRLNGTRVQLGQMWVDEGSERTFTRAESVELIARRRLVVGSRFVRDATRDSRWSVWGKDGDQVTKYWPSFGVQMKGRADGICNIR